MDNQNKASPRAATEQDAIIGHNIRICRILSGVRTDQVVEQLDIKAPQYYKLESGKTRTTLARASKLADIFDMSVNDFVKNEQEFSLEELSIIKPLIINFLKLEDMQHRRDVWKLITELSNNSPKHVSAACDINSTKLLAKAYLSVESGSCRARIMNFIYGFCLCG